MELFLALTALLMLTPFFIPEPACAAVFGMNLPFTLPHVNVGANLLIGVVAALLVQWAKTSPRFPWLTPEMNAGIQALVVIISILAAVAQAAHTGDLTSLDWKALLETLSANATIVWLAIVNVYQHLIKPNAKAPDVVEWDSDLPVEAPPSK